MIDALGAGGALRDRLRRLISSRGASTDRSTTQLRRPVTGVVERVGPKLLVGWISVPTDTPPTPVTLHVGNVKLSSTYPTAGGAVNGMSVTWSDDTVLTKPRSRRARGVAGGPARGRRNSAQEIRTFSFQIQDVWAYMKRKHRMSVRCGGQPLPIAGHGMFITPNFKGDKTPAQLAELVRNGHVLTQTGHIALSKRVDTAWQAAMMKLYRRTAEVIRDRFGYETFAMYGTLLGAVREGGYIGHDADFDCAYISDRTSGPEAAEELVAVSLALLESGLRVDLRHRMLHIHDPEDPDLRIDLFHLFFDHAGLLRCPWGIAGTTIIQRDDWSGTKEIDFPGGSIRVPVNDEQFVEHLYGEDWKLPKPGFNWTLSRTDLADDGKLSDAQRTHVYWADFYARNSYTDGSPFFEFINDRPDLPGLVVDIGCGDGRDSRAFGGAGRRVVGLDQSEVGIAHAAEGAAQAALDAVSFEVCDVSDPAAIRSVLDRVTAEADGPVLFYLRFFLHAIKEETQNVLMAAIEECSRPGDMFAAEFRTDRDEEKSKTHGNHYRRFQNAEKFSDDLVAKWGFEILESVEGTGLSPYRDEDPVLFRVVARRTAN